MRFGVLGPLTMTAGDGKPVPLKGGRLRALLSVLLLPANRDIPRGSNASLPECWLLAEWRPGEDEPTDYWLSTLPTETQRLRHRRRRTVGGPMAIRGLRTTRRLGNLRRTTRHRLTHNTSRNT